MHDTFWRIAGTLIGAAFAGGIIGRISGNGVWIGAGVGVVIGLYVVHPLILWTWQMRKT